MLSPRERIELNMLLERAFGADSHVALDAGDIDRLNGLQDRLRSGEVPDASQGHGTSDAVAVVSRRRWLGLVGLTVVGLGLFAAGVGVGCWTAAQHDGEWFELSLAQTSEDALPYNPNNFDPSAFATNPPEFDRTDPDAGLDPASVRYIATMDDVALYLGHLKSSSDICLAAVRLADSLASVSCGAATVVTEQSTTLWIQVERDDGAGRSELIPSTLVPLKLSASVTAYVPQR